MKKPYEHFVNFTGKLASSRNIFILTGIASTLWFLLRVIPKPQRATYPCMRAAAPLMSAFVCYVLSMLGVVGSLKLLRLNLKRAKYVPAMVCLGVFAMALVAFNVQETREGIAASLPTVDELNSFHTAGGPLGDPQGIVPGRVVWAWDDRATQNNANYWEEQYNDQYVIDRMLTAAVISIAGEDGTVGDSKDIVVAWDKIFTHFNDMRATRFGETARQGRGYRPGEKVFIKINNTSLYDLWNSNQRSTGKLVESNAFSLLALIKHLVEYVGVNPADIYVGDPHRGFHVVDRAYVESAYPNIKVTPMGTLANSTGGADIIYSSPTVGTGSDAIDVNHRDATYIFNIPAVKGHGSGGYSATAKNFFGCIMRTHHYSQGMILHPTLPDQDYGNTSRYRVLVDMMASKQMGQKTVLYIADALYTGKGDAWNGTSNSWNMAPFNNGGLARNPSSLFVSLDQVAIESVCYDMMSLPASGNTNVYRDGGTEDFLHQAAAPSIRPGGIQYNPEGNKPLTYSLGVHAHGSLSGGYPEGTIELVRLKSSDIAEGTIPWSSTSIENLVNYPQITDVIKVKQTETTPSAYNDAIWEAEHWRRMDYQYLKGGSYVNPYEGWKGLNINPQNYAGMYKYLYNPAEKEMYVLAKIKDNNLITAPASGWSTSEYWQLYDVMEVFFAPVATAGVGYRCNNPLATRGYAQHITLGNLSGGAYPVNHAIDVATGGVIDCGVGAGSVVKAGKATKVGDYYYWELTFDISEIPQSTFDNETTVKFSMAYNDIDYNNGVSGAVGRTGQYGTVFNPNNKAGDSNAPYNNIAAMGSIVFEKDIAALTISPKTKTVTTGEQVTFSTNMASVTYSIESGGAFGSLTGNVLTTTGEGTIVVRATSTADAGLFDEATITVDAPAAVTGITISPKTQTVTVGTPVTFSATVAPPNAVDKSVTYSIVSGGAFGSLAGNVLTTTDAGTITVRATSADAYIYDEATITVNALPSCTPVAGKDLIVEAITWSPLNPQPGDLVAFTATVRNIGTTTINAGEQLGVLFRLSQDNNCNLGYLANSNTYVWSDQNKAPLGLTTAINTCETIQLTTNGGDCGIPYWTAGQVVTVGVPQTPAPGTWYVCAEVNDQGDLVGENRANNKLSVSFEVGGIFAGDNTATSGKSIIAYGRTIEIRGMEQGETVAVYNLVGVKVYSARATQDPELITALQPGVYTVVVEGAAQKVVVR